MSKVAIVGNASGTGTFTIAAPNSDSDRTLTLPDEAGTVLTSASDIPAANLTGDLPAGVAGLTLLSAVTASSASGVTWNSSYITTDYDSYLLIGMQVQPASNDGNPILSLSTDNGVSAFPTVYTGRQYNKYAGASSGHEYDSSAGGDYKVAQRMGTSGASYEVWLHGVSTSGSYKNFTHHVSGWNFEPAAYSWKGGATVTTSSAINYVKFYFNNGNIAYGKFYLYGVKKS
jgi:hypothetical protein